MKHIGLDTHSATTMATVLNDRGQKILTREIPTRKSDLIRLMESIPGPKRVALEENQLADFITRLIGPYANEVIRCQPQHNRLISESEDKCDKQDSYNIANLLFLNRLKSVHHPSLQYQQLRQAVRAYWKVSTTLTREKNRLKALYLYNGICCEGDKAYSKKYRVIFQKELQSSCVNGDVIGLQYRALDFSRELKAEHIRLMRKLGEPFGDDIKRLMGVPGVGRIGAYTLVAYLEDGWRLSKKSKLWQYCGAGIRKHESSKTGHRSASRRGNRHLKNVLFTAVASISARKVENNALTKMWKQGVAKNVDRDHLRRNLGRKVVVIVQRLLRNKEEYNDELVAKRT